MHKKATLVAAALIVLALFLAVPAWPGTIPASLVPEGARWIAHLDMEKFVATDLYGSAGEGRQVPDQGPGHRPLAEDGPGQGHQGRDRDRARARMTTSIVFAVAGTFDKAGHHRPGRARQGAPGDVLRRLHPLLVRERRVRRVRQRQSPRLLRGPRGDREGPRRGRQAKPRPSPAPSSPRRSRMCPRGPSSAASSTTSPAWARRSASPSSSRRPRASSSWPRKSSPGSSSGSR
ncbi:MAG: hypothetical protein M0C28_25150 [Candidatus Moduliflexus flocculans]|nr:hypothetical protein [Candidatus Moduliflexus flocculans]